MTPSLTSSALALALVVAFPARAFASPERLSASETLGQDTADGPRASAQTEDKFQGEAAPPERTPDAPPEPAPDASLERYRTPLEALTERFIGTSSRAVRFDWRRSTVAFGVLGSELLERNNFGSARLGVFARRPFGDLIGELALSRAFTWSTDSSDKLALTPYRQAARPSRFELDVNVGYPLAEGVVTGLPSFVPPGELVFSASAGFRYLFYPRTLAQGTFTEVAGALFAPRLTDRELGILERERLPGMQLDLARYALMAGLSLDVYLQPGLLVSPRVQVALPLLSPVNGTRLGFWWELNLSLGWAL